MKKYTYLCGVCIILLGDKSLQGMMWGLPINTGKTKKQRAEQTRKRVEEARLYEARVEKAKKETLHFEKQLDAFFKRHQISNGEVEFRPEPQIKKTSSTPKSYFKTYENVFKVDYNDPFYKLFNAICTNIYTRTTNYILAHKLEGSLSSYTKSHVAHFAHKENIHALAQAQVAFFAELFSFLSNELKTFDAIPDHVIKPFSDQALYDRLHQDLFAKKQNQTKQNADPIGYPETI